MDLTIKFKSSNEVLNVRVAIIMQTKNGFVISHSKDGGWYFAIGGRAKLGESSIDSAIREVWEETGLTLKKEDFKLISIIENFWTSTHDTSKGADWKVHEINYVFTVPNQEQIFEAVDSANVVEMPLEKIANLDFRPEVIKKMILENRLDTFSHHIVK